MEKEGEEEPSMEIEDTRPLGEQVMDACMTILTEPVMGLTELAAKYGCTYKTYFPAEGPEMTNAMVWEPRYEDEEERYYQEDVRWEERPCEYYVVEDAMKREIYIIQLVPGDELSREH